MLWETRCRCINSSSLNQREDVLGLMSLLCGMLQALPRRCEREREREREEGREGPHLAPAQRISDSP